MNIKESKQYQTKLFQLQKDVHEAQHWLNGLKEKGYDSHSPVFVHACTVLRCKNELLDEFKSRMSEIDMPI